MALIKVTRLLRSHQNCVYTDNTCNTDFKISLLHHFETFQEWLKYFPPKMKININFTEKKIHTQKFFPPSNFSIKVNETSLRNYTYNFLGCGQAFCFLFWIFINMVVTANSALFHAFHFLYNFCHSKLMLKPFKVASFYRYEQNQEISWRAFDE